MSIIYGTLERLETEHKPPVTEGDGPVAPLRVVESEGLLWKTLSAALIVVLAGTSLMLWRQVEDLTAPPTVTASASVKAISAPQVAESAVNPTAASNADTVTLAPVETSVKRIPVQSFEPLVSNPAESIAVATDPVPVVAPQPPEPAPLEESAVVEPAVAVVTGATPVKARPVIASQAAVTPAVAEQPEQPAQVDAVIDQARSALSTGRYQQALATLETLAPLPDHRADFWLVKGSAHLGLGQLEQAEMAFDAAQGLTAASAHISIQRAIVQQEKGNHVGAMEILNAAASQHPDVPEIYLNLGYSQLALGGQLEAKRSFRAFLTMTEGRSLYQQQRTALKQWLAQFPSVQ